MSEKYLRPYVICHMVQSADGKVTGDFLSSEECQAACEIYYKLNREYSADAFACGSTTMAESFTGGFYPQLEEYSEEGIELEDYIAEGSFTYFAVAFDRRGRLGWQTPVIQDEDPGYGNAHIIEVLSKKVDRRYLAYLRGIGVSYIFAGEDGSDIPLALSKLYQYFGICNLLLEGGSEINGAFAEAGVIDELSLVVTPLKSAEGDKPLFARPLKQDPKFMNATPYDGGIILMRYSVG